MTLYLTRFRINPARRGARKLLGSPHVMHAAVRLGFPNIEDYERGSSRTLWRIDNPAPATVHLYIVSPGKPDLTHLVEQAGWPTTEAWDSREYSGLLSSLDSKQRWAFRLTANPVHNGRLNPDSAQTKRFGCLREAEQAQWLLKRAEQYGFVIPHQADGEPNLKLHQRQTLTFKRGNGRVTLVTATYDGLLDIVDAERFRQALTGGIGHGKAYGCGLLTLAPAG
jgi:CRISPR system Cascade subunit CasE